jgi:hypothetical protein
MNKKLAVISTGVAGCVLALMWLIQPQATKISAPQNTAAKSNPMPVPAEVPANLPAAEQPAKVVVMPAEVAREPQRPQKQNLGRVANPKEPIQDPNARVALSLVGVDPDAEAYWLGAITDPNLSKQEREDLMEDLNEDGLSDPKHPGPEDMPLIANRIRLIEEIVPYADDFMLEHLGEAHKDLSNLLAGNPAN